MANIVYEYAYVAVATTGGGDSAPSPFASISAPATLSPTTAYITAAFPSVVGTTYKLLRQRQGVDAQWTYLTSVTASATTVTIVDQGQFAPVPYAAQRGNEFQLPELVKYLRVYMLDGAGNEQPLVPYDIPQLGGQTDETWDQSSGVVLGAPQFTPQWKAQAPTTFPVPSPIRGQVPVNSPWMNTAYSANQRPGYYLRGGFIGIIPPPLSTYTVVLDYLPKPPDFVTDSDVSIYPDAFRDAICYKMLEYMAMGESDSRDDDYAMKYEMQVKKLREAFCNNLQGDRPRTVVPLTIRTQRRAWAL